MNLQDRLAEMIERARRLQRAGNTDKMLARATREARAALLNAASPDAPAMIEDLTAKADALMQKDPLKALSARRRLAIVKAATARPVTQTAEMNDAFSALSRALARVEA